MGCINKSENNSATYNLDDSSFSKLDSSLIVIDTLNFPSYLYNTRNDTSYIDTTKVIKSELKQPLGITLFSGENYTGESKLLVPGTYTPEQIPSFIQTGIHALNIPFGLSADILYNTNIKLSPNLIQNGNPVFRQVMKKLENQLITQNRYYGPGEYSSIERSLVSPKLVTIYPWTDFYLSTDDPSVPSFLDEIVVSWGKTDGQKGNYSVKGKLSDPDKKHHKIITYKVPKNRKINIWESTGNGDKGWSKTLDSATNVLTIDLWVMVRPVAGPRNWIGVRASVTE